MVKCCLYGLLKIMKFMLILGQVRLSKGKLYPAGLGMVLGKDPTGLKPAAGARNRGKKP